MTNKETIEKVIKAFENNDVAGILAQLTDDAEWQMLGDKTIKGKDAWRAFFAAHPEMTMVSSTTNHIIIDGDNAAVDGEVSCKDKDGKQFDMYYCDLYELQNAKVKKMVTYSVNKK
jgi:ketosteroid isomerase-like protein